MIEANGVLYVRMFGGFQMYADGQEILLKSGNTTKAMQILQLLLYRAPQKISTTSLIAQIFAYDDILSPSNNLKASISLLRRQLRASGLPGDDFISFRDGGYVWNCPLELKVDAHEFEEVIKLSEFCSEADEKARRYREALSIYSGNFLPELLGVDWASPLNVYYCDAFAKVARGLCRFLEDEGEYEQILPVTEQAYRYLHTDEWQLLRMKALMQLGRWDEAKQVYMDAVAAMARDFDVQPSEEMLEQYRIISSKISNALGTFHDMLDSVRESEEIGGAYCCTYPGFIDSSRVTARSMERSGISCYLMLCCLGDSSGAPLQNADRLQEASEKLQSAIQNSLRSSDFFTQYNLSQYLIFLVGTCRENCGIIEERIENNFRSLSVRGVRLSFEVSSAVQQEMDRLGGNPPRWH